MAAVDLITKDDLAPVLEELRAVRLELERLRAANGPDLVTLPEAARRPATHPENRNSAVIAY